jgi:hypothetical protein
VILSCYYPISIQSFQLAITKLIHETKPLGRVRLCNLNRDDSQIRGLAQQWLPKCAHMQYYYLVWLPSKGRWKWGLGRSKTSALAACVDQVNLEMQVGSMLSWTLTLDYNWVFSHVRSQHSGLGTLSQEVFLCLQPID